MARRWFRGAAAAAAIGLVVGGSTVAWGASTVRMKDGAASSENFFRPRTLRVERGTRVVWRNSGARPHTTTSNSGLWDSETLQPGESFRRRFRKAGTFRYHCEIHSGMTGKIVVRA
jgi:plastocyanin